MSWDARLVDDRGHEEGSWNYTHNCNEMIEEALGKDLLGTTRSPWWASRAGGLGRHSWWDLLDGETGPQGAAFLHRLITRLEEDPERFRSMNPDNGWGNYDRLLVVLKEMRNAVPEWPTTWEVSG